MSPYKLIDEINSQDLFLYGHRNISSVKITWKSFIYNGNRQIWLKSSLILPHPLPFSLHTPSLLAPPPSLFSQVTSTLTSTLSFCSDLFVSCLYCTYSCMCCACRYWHLYCHVYRVVCVVSVDVDIYIVMSTGLYVLCL